MKKFALILIMTAALAVAIGAAASAAAAETVVYKDYTVPGVTFGWQTVVNNGVKVPVEGDNRKFNSYNPPSLNVERLVVFRARSKGGMGGQPVHGVFTRDMAVAGTPVTTIFDRKTTVPQPNNILWPPNDLLTTFIEPPSFPRIDMWSDTIASRGNHQPVWNYVVAPIAHRRADRDPRRDHRHLHEPLRVADRRHEQPRRRARLRVLRGPGDRPGDQVRCVPRRPRGDRRRHRRVQGELHGGRRGPDRRLLPRPDRRADHAC